MRLFAGNEIRATSEFFTVLYSTPHTQIASMTLEPGRPSGPFGTEHPNSDQILAVIDGQVEAKVDNETLVLGAGDTIFIKAGERHQVVCCGKKSAKTLNIYGPPAYPKDD